MSERRPSLGDVTGEYLAVRRDCGLIPAARDLIWVRGPDAGSFLDGLLSQTIIGSSPGTVTRSFLLAPNGKLRALLHVLAGGEEFGLVADEGWGETVRDDLSRFRIRVDVAIEAETRQLFELWGPGSGRVLTAAGFGTPDGWAAEPFVARLPFALAAVPRYLVAADEAALLGAGALRVGTLAIDAARIEAGEPVMGRDVDESTIPHESGLVPSAVDFEKGCYLGQELVARIGSRGHVNRTLRGVVVTRNVVPPLGAEIRAGERSAGTVTSVAESLDVGAPVGLALVRREVTSGDVVDLTWEGGGVPAEVRDLPLVSDPVR